MDPCASPSPEANPDPIFDPVADFALICVACSLVALVIGLAVVAGMYDRAACREERRRERARAEAFTTTAQFYVYDATRGPPPNPHSSADYVADQEIALDDDGEPKAVSGAALYASHVTPGPPAPPVARAALGGGRLQRLWLLHGSTGGGKNTAAGERRLRRLAELRESGDRLAAAQQGLGSMPPPIAAAETDTDGETEGFSVRRPIQPERV